MTVNTPLQVVLDLSLWHADVRTLCTVRCVSRSARQLSDTHGRWRLLLHRHAGWSRLSQEALARRSTEADWIPNLCPEVDPATETIAHYQQWLMAAESTGMARYRRWFSDCVAHERLQSLVFTDGYQGFRATTLYDAEMADFEAENNLLLPSAYKRLFAIDNIQSIFFGIYPTNNSLLSPRQIEVSELPASLRATVHSQTGPGTNKLLKFIDENQGCCYWYMAINSDDPDPAMDPPVYIGDLDMGRYTDTSVDDANDTDDTDDMDAESMLELCAPTLSMFLRHYFVDGINWYHDNPGYMKPSKLFGCCRRHLRPALQRMQSKCEHCECTTTDASDTIDDDDAGGHSDTE